MTLNSLTGVLREERIKLPRRVVKLLLHVHTSFEHFPAAAASLSIGLVRPGMLPTRVLEICGREGE